MKYIIIGLGNYGHVLAEELSALGHEIIGADISESRVDSIKDKVATAFVIDATDEQSLSVLPLNSVDIVIVAIGENFWCVDTSRCPVEAEKGSPYFCPCY